MAARTFDGTNDNLLSANNAVAGIDTDQKSWSAWIYLTAAPAALQNIMMAGTSDGAGNGRFAVYADAPLTAGYRPYMFADGSTDGNWRGTDVSINARHHIAVTYDRGATTNDPVMYVDGATITVTELSTPVTLVGGDDTIKFGENMGGSQDFAGSILHAALDGAILWTAAQVNRAMWWGRPHGGLEVYHPFLTTKLADEGSAAETLTATGTTSGTVVTPCVRPGSAMLGMGVGW